MSNDFFDVDRQIAVLWERDNMLGLSDSIHRKSSTAAEALTARGADYAAGFRRAVTSRGTVDQAIRWYKHLHHAQVIDVGIFRVGFERGLFVSNRTDDTTLTAAVTLPLAQRNVYANTHFVYVPFEPGVRLRGESVQDVRQAFISATPKTLHLSPGVYRTVTGLRVVTPALLAGLGQPVLEFIPVGESLLRTPPAARRR